MAGRSCQGCKHYEPAPLWRQGWCRNPRLYSPQQSHLVTESELGCGFGTGTYWEAAEITPAIRDAAMSASEPSDDKLPSLAGRARDTLRIAKARPGLGAIPGVNAAMSTGSGFGTGGGSGREDRGDDPWTPASARPSEADEQPTTYTAPRADRAARPQGQERTVSYQPEERYWTDYLRVALPVVGLLLMLGLFLFWANQLINPNDPPTEPPVTLTDTQDDGLIGASSPVATVTTAPELTANPETDAQPTAAPADQDAAAVTATSAPAADVAAPTATAESAEGGDADSSDGDLAIDQTVQTNDAGVNLREESTTDSSVVMQLESGQQMTVIDGPVSGESYQWYQVEFQDASGNAVQGWVASDFIEPA